MKLLIEDALNLVVEVMKKYGHNEDYAKIIGEQ